MQQHVHELMEQRDEQTALMARVHGHSPYFAGGGGGGGDDDATLEDRDSLPGSDDDGHINQFTRRNQRGFDGHTRQARPARGGGGGGAVHEQRLRVAAGGMDRERDRAPADMAMPPIDRPVSSLELAKLDALFPPHMNQMGHEVEHECFACHYARNDCVPKIAVQGYHGLMTLVQSADSGTCRVTLADEVRRYYEGEIREPGNRFIAAGMTPFPEWRTRTIFKHYFTPEHGRNDARASARWRTHILEQVVYTMANTGLFVERQEGVAPPVRAVNTQVLEIFLKANNALNQMIKMDLSKLGGAGSAFAPPAQTVSNTLMGPDRMHQPQGAQRIRSTLMH